MTRRRCNAAFHLDAEGWRAGQHCCVRSRSSSMKEQEQQEEEEDIMRIRPLTRIFR